LEGLVFELARTLLDFCQNKYLKDKSVWSEAPYLIVEIVNQLQERIANEGGFINPGNIDDCLKETLQVLENDDPTPMYTFTSYVKQTTNDNLYSESHNTHLFNNTVRPGSTTNSLLNRTISNY
jgi:hypothetical protein